MRADGFGDAGATARRSAGMLNSVRGDRSAEIPGEEPLLRPHDPPIVTQRVEQFRREHDIAVLAALALDHPDHHPLVIERAGLQANGLGNAQAGGVAGRQDRLVLMSSTQPRKWRTSARLSTTGNFWGCLGAGMLASKFQP